MKLTSVEHIGRWQLLPGVGRTVLGATKARTGKLAMLDLKAKRTACLLGFVLLAACGVGSDSARLRITNVGDMPIRNLTVLFPEDQVHFGDVAVGETSRYVDVPHGVYHYAAYRLEIDGALITQPVIDWVGEEQMQGESFTYSLAASRQRVELVMVTVDN
jgi:hypothetical protein